APGATVLSAVARFYVIKFEHPSPVTVHRVTADWNEATVTWDSINTSMDLLPVATIPSGTPQDQFVDVNLTGLVQSWINGAEPNYGLLIAPSVLNVGETSEYTSKEHATSSQRPYLEIKVANASLANRASISATGKLLSGASATATRSDITLTQPPSNISWQPGAELEDAFIWAGAHEGKNFGVSPILNIKNDRNVLIRFALEALPPGARIVDAKLVLYLEGGGGVTDGVLDVHALSRSWVEGIYDDQAPPAGAGVTYQSYDGQTNWSTPGGDYDATVIDSITLPTMIPGWYEWNVTAQIQDWLDGTPNYGFLLREGGGDAGDIEFVSSDNTVTPEFRPRLSITLACECGITCQIPQGSGKVLLVVGDDVTLNASDVKKKSLFEAWGYTVKLLDDNANQAAFDANLNNNDVAYVSASSSDALVADKLVNTIRGVVNENSGQNNNLGLSSAGSQVVTSGIAVVDNSHFITALFPAGVIPLNQAPMEALVVTGTAAPDLQTLGELAGTDSLALVDSGDMLQSGSYAAGRRVSVPVGRTSGFNWDYFNNNGRLIVQRALQWASNIITGSVNTIILSTKDPAELGGLSFQDTDLVEYTVQTDSATLFLDSAAAGLTTNIDAVHVLANGHIIFSTTDDVTFAGLSFSKEDLVEYDPVANTAIMYLDAELHFDSKADIISVHILDNGNVVLSTDGDATLGGLNFSKFDLVEYNRSTGTASIFFDGDATSLSEQITAVHVLQNGHIVLTADKSTTLGGISFSPDQLIEYD
ncbi:MAG: DNRLRE domain-containing protein, partial [Gammaproteobacteria bacterium]